MSRSRRRTPAARAKGKPLGRPSRVRPEQYRLIHQMADAGARQATIAATTGLSRARSSAASSAARSPASPGMTRIIRGPPASSPYTPVTSACRKGG